MFCVCFLPDSFLFYRFQAAFPWRFQASPWGRLFFVVYCALVACCVRFRASTRDFKTTIGLRRSLCHQVRTTTEYIYIIIVLQLKLFIYILLLTFPPLLHFILSITCKPTPHQPHTNAVAAYVTLAVV